MKPEWFSPLIEGKVEIPDAFRPAAGQPYPGGSAAEPRRPAVGRTVIHESSVTNPIYCMSAWVRQSWHLTDPNGNIERHFRVGNVSSTSYELLST